MKFVIFIACWLYFAFTHQIQAQVKPDNKLKDTLIIHLKGDNQVHIIGSSLEEIAKYRSSTVETTTTSVKGKKKEEKRYNSPDSLKSLFLADYQKAVTAETITNTSRNIHYLVSKEGKRRMKASTDAFTEEPFDLQAEIKRLEMNLPAYHYIIYDLLSAMEVHFYLEDSASLTLLKDLNLDDAVKYLGNTKEVHRKFYRLEVENENNNFAEMAKKGRRKVSFELSSFIGAGIFGNQPNAFFGPEISFIKSNKYSRPIWRAGINTSLHGFTDFKDGRFEFINYPIGFECFFSLNRSKGSREWLGLHYGIFISEEGNPMMPVIVRKSGWHVTGPGNIMFSYDLIGIVPREELIMSFSMKVPF